MPQTVIFTDLDGTLLDRHTYSFAKARKALNEIRKMKIPLVLCSSKTKAEIEIYRRKLHNNDPFVPEDGSAIYIPENYFSFKFPHDRKEGRYKVIELGMPVHYILHFNRFLKFRGIDFIGFNDVTPEYIQAVTNLPKREAVLTKKRSYSEPLILLDKKHEKSLRKIAAQHSLNVLRTGRYFVIVGNTSKGKAIGKLISLFRKKYGKVRSVAFGNSENDFEMLRTVDEGFIVRKSDGRFEASSFRKADGIGPEGFNAEVNRMIERKQME